MYVHTFKVISNRHLTKTQIYLYENPNPEQLTSVSDKLKWYRIHNGFLQRDVAKAMGVDRTTYSHYEENILDSYPLDKLEQAATLFQLDLIDLLDEYNLFLYRGQGQKIKELRKSLRLTQSEFAKSIHVPLGTLKKWEQNKVRMQKDSFAKIQALNK